MQTYPQYYPQMNNYGQQYNPQQPYMDRLAGLQQYQQTLQQPQMAGIQMSLPNQPRENYKESTGAIEELIQETVSFESDSEYTIYFNRPSYGFKVSVPENPELKVSIVDSSDFYIKVRITNIKAKTDVKVKVEGYEYLTEENNYIVNHNVSPRKQSIGYKTGNMAAFMYAGSKRKRKKRVKGK